MAGGRHAWWARWRQQSALCRLLHHRLLVHAERAVRDGSPREGSRRLGHSVGLGAERRQPAATRERGCPPRVRDRRSNRDSGRQGAGTRVSQRHRRRPGARSPSRRSGGGSDSPTEDPSPNSISKRLIFPDQSIQLTDGVPAATGGEDPARRSNEREATGQRRILGGGTSCSLWHGLRETQAPSTTEAGCSPLEDRLGRRARRVVGSDAAAHRAPARAARRRCFVMRLLCLKRRPGARRLMVEQRLWHRRLYRW